MLQRYAEFEIDDRTGEALTVHDRIDLHYDRVLALQKVAFRHFQEDLQDFAVSNVASVDTKKALMKHFKDVSKENMHTILAHLHQLPMPTEDSTDTPEESFMRELLVSL